MLFSIQALPLLMVALVTALSSFALPLARVSAEDSPPQAVDLVAVTSGLQGTWKVGFHTPHQILLKAHKGGRYQVELETVDGDGVRVIYGSAEWALNLADGEEKGLTLLAKHGRANHPIHLRVFAREANFDPQTPPIIDRSLSEAERGTALNSEQPWVVGIGSEGMKLDSVMLRSARSNLGDYTYTELTRAKELPATSQAYDGVDLLVFSSSNAPLLGELSPVQSVAVQEWVSRGGRCWLTLGKGAAAWFQHPSLRQLVPGELIEIADRCSPGPLESFLNSQVRLAPLQSAIVDLPENSLELTGQKVDRGRYPLLARWSMGSGKVRFLATEIDSQEIKDWESQPALIKLILNDAWEGRGVQQRTLALAEDLSLQLSQALDRFAGLRMASLAQLATLMAILLAILGPLDYFLVAKRWKRPRATWLTLAMTSLLACLGLALLQKDWKPSASSLNTLEIVDVDASTNTYAGRAYSHLYGGPRGLYELRNKASAEAIGGASEVQLEWLGQPGGGLGGFDSTVASDQLFPAYRIQRVFDTSENSPLIEHLGIPEAGTKGFVSQWGGTISEPRTYGTLASHSGAIDLLDGELRNPLDRTILNGILIYRGRFYTMPLRFKPEDTMQVNVSVVPKDFTRRLQRRVNIDGKDQGTPWDRNETDLTRLAEILSFHRAAAGLTYTGLIDRYLSHLDLSDVMKSERAILFGELEEPQVQWSVHRDSNALDVQNGVRSTMIRILIPVALPASRNPSKLPTSSNPS